MWGCVGFAALAAVVWLLVWWLHPDARRARRFEAELAARAPLSDAEMARQYFAAGDTDPEVPARVRRVFAKHMGYPADKLLPDDDLAFFWAELDMAELIEEIESGFAITLTPAEAERTPCTIRGVVDLVASKPGRAKRRP